MHVPRPKNASASGKCKAFRQESAYEDDQKRISQFLEGTDGALCQMNDILVFGKMTEEHDKHLEATLQKLQEAITSLWMKRSASFWKLSVEYPGSIIDS